jgi:hypothetical protein
MGLEILLMKKFMDLVVSSPRTAERIASISRHSPEEDYAEGGDNDKKLGCNGMICIEKQLQRQNLFKS